MEKPRTAKWKFLLVMVFSAAFVFWVYLKEYILIEPTDYQQTTSLLIQKTSEQAITPIWGTKHLMISAYKDHQEEGLIRVISIVNRWELTPLSCIIHCSRHGIFITNAEVNMHSDHFGFPFVTTDILCKTEPRCDPSYITISNSPYVSDLPKKVFLSIQNREKKDRDFPYNFTVCVSNLFGNYDNVLQFVQTVEVYKLLGIQKLYIYNTSCGPQLNKVLQYYSSEGFIEVQPWPIDQFLNPSKGWNHDEHGGDIHYYGQLTTLNDCIYRNMYTSKYLLLNDIDEIIVPYQHASLGLLMENLQLNEPSTSVFLIENHIFPKNVFDNSGRFNFSKWKKVPGINIMEHVYREPDRKEVFNPTKMIINPRLVEQTSVHSVLKNNGDTYRVPPEICRIIHVRVPLQGSLTKEQLIVDKKLWEYETEIIQNVNKVLTTVGMLD